MFVSGAFPVTKVVRLKASFILLIEQNIPLIIPLPKRKEIIANIESLFADARAEKFGEDSGWVSS